MALDVDARISGLKDVERALEAAFPRDPRKQRSVLTSGMRRGARTMLVDAKLRALRGDSSGALSESLAIRSVSNRAQRQIKDAGQVTAALQIASVRGMKRAIAKYNAFYNKNVKSIRHAHLVEFGHGTRGDTRVGPRPFLWPAVQANSSLYVNLLSQNIRKAIDLAVKRAAKKRAKR